MPQTIQEINITTVTEAIDRVAGLLNGSLTGMKDALDQRNQEQELT